MDDKKTSLQHTNSIRVSHSVESGVNHVDAMSK